MKYDFDEVIDRRGTFSMKWDAPELHTRLGLAERFDADTIPIHVADMDFRCAKPIQEALMKVCEHNIYGYTGAFPFGYGLKYYEAIIGWFRRRMGWEIKPDEITYVNGTVEGIRGVIDVFSEEGDGVLITCPIYGPFMGTVRSEKRQIVNSSLKNNDGFYEIDFEDFEKKAAMERTKVFLLCNPHNPTGRIWSDEDLKRMADICRRHGVVIFADEIHGDLIRRESEFHPIAKVAGPEGIITGTALNKTFNIAGLQASNLVIQDPALMERFRSEAPHITPNPFTVAATIAAYNEGEEWLEQLIDYLDANIDYVISFFRERMPKVKVHRPEGTYILWLDFRGYGLPYEVIRKKIGVDANVFMEGGPQFDPENGAGFERLCVPTRRSLLTEALERIAAQFENL